MESREQLLQEITQEIKGMDRDSLRHLSAFLTGLEAVRKEESGHDQA